MQLNIKKRMLVALLSMAACCLQPAGAADTPVELTGYPKIYQQWFDEASVEFNVPAELLQSIAYAETRWRPNVPKGMKLKTGEEVTEVEAHPGDMPPSYGIMGLRNDPHFGSSLIQAAALIHETPTTLQTDTRANIRGAAALLAQYGNHKTRTTPVEQWEDAVAQYSGIPQREIADIHTYEVLNAIHEGRGGDGYKIRQHSVDLEKVYGKDKLQKLSASHLVVKYSGRGATISVPDAGK
jgi:hypothetical protein